jgi:GNAT superfamily N-acetyltransferase
MKLVYLPTPQHAMTEAIRSRSEESSKCQLTRHYAGWEDDAEVVLVSLDIYDRQEYSDWEYLVIYELYVPEPLRNKGIGSRGLQAAELFARELGFRKTFVHAKPLFDTRTQQEMVNWYRGRGYKPLKGQPFDLEKIV